MLHPITLIPNPELEFVRMQILNLSYDQYDRLWKMFVDALSSKLILCKGRHVEGSKDSHRLLELLHQAGSLRCAKALSHPSRIASYHYSMGQVLATPLGAFFGGVVGARVLTHGVQRDGLGWEGT